MLETEDPNTVIINQGYNFTTYKDLNSSEVWVIMGSCNCCGQCEDSNNHNIIWTGKIGEPNAEHDKTFDTRKDIPVRPEIKQNCPRCTLWGFYV